MVPEYQVLARKYRPQSFRDVLGQNNIVQTLKNAIKNKRLAHAYLFCGSRGTGKTTLARVLAKALNCDHPTSELEPCNQCSSCREITSGNSLDVLEIDGASHRGIDDIRQINETVGYTASSGKYKIYIIDEVHMLTKEAFNALLKTLEEPPPKVMFFFATTEPHKVLPTILSRCQRFNLNRIPLENIIGKLKYICEQQQVSIEDGAVRLLAQRAEGGLRDAESLLDQIIAFQDGGITTASIADILGIMPRQVFFELDRAGKEGNLGKAFEIADQVFSQGKDLSHFLEGLVNHFRTLLAVKVAGKDAPYVDLLTEERDSYEGAAKLYTQEQCLSILDMLTEAIQQIRFTPAPRIALEAILLKILRIHLRIPIEFLVRRLAELEKAVRQSPAVELESNPPPLPLQGPALTAAPTPPPIAVPAPAPMSISEDPTPSPADYGRKGTGSKKQPTEPPSEPPAQQVERKAIQTKSPAAPVNQPQSNEEAMKKQSEYDTLLQFAAVELEGAIQKKSPTRPK